MAKNDDARTRTMIGQENDSNVANTNVLRNKTIDQGSELKSRFDNSSEQQGENYNQIFGGYQGFAKDGGYSDQNIQDIRSRSLSPLRAVYANAGRAIERQKSLQGGYSPGHNVLQARMAREMGQGLADANTNVNAGIAEMVNKGKLSGLSGMGNTYASSPGLVNTYGGLMQNNTQQQLGLNSQDINRGLGYTQIQEGLTRAPGKFGSAMGNINAAFDTVGKIGSTVGGF